MSSMFTIYYTGGCHILDIDDITHFFFNCKKTYIFLYLFTLFNENNHPHCKTLALDRNTNFVLNENVFFFTFLKITTFTFIEKVYHESKKVS